jgi:hypothetical protein
MELLKIQLQDAGRTAVKGSHPIRQQGSVKKTEVNVTIRIM